MGREVALAAEVQLFVEGADLVLVVAETVEHGDGDAPAFAGGFVAAGLLEGGDGAEALKACVVAFEDFAAPDGAVGAVSRTVHGDADDGLVAVVFGHTAENVGVVVLEGQQREAEFPGGGVRVVARVEVAGHEGGLGL